ncbi:peptidase S8/S53 domain-containing protein [Trichoderma sp. SZMC 28015]
MDKLRDQEEVNSSTPLQTTSEAQEERKEKLPKLKEIWERIAPELSKFTKKYSDLVQDAHDGSCGYRPTRIAIVDTGMVDIRLDTDNIGGLTIDRQQLGTHRTKEGHEHCSRRPIDETLWSRINKRRSRVKKRRSRIRKRLSLVDDDDPSSRRFLASDAHGIQMARIIGSIDPCCVFYIARVSSRRSGVTPTRVAEAILGAISKGVDVISMSFGLGETTYELEDACCEATKRGIAMLCSAHVEGINLTHAYPAGCFGTIPIIACDESGITPPGNKKLGNEFAINVSAGITPVLNSNENISESSVATAIAAGISSLILSCHQLAHKGEEDFEQKGRQTMLIARIDRYVNEERDIDIQAILQTFFRD